MFFKDGTIIPIVYNDDFKALIFNAEYENFCVESIDIPVKNDVNPLEIKELLTQYILAALRLDDINDKLLTNALSKSVNKIISKIIDDADEKYDATISETEFLSKMTYWTNIYYSMDIIETTNPHNKLYSYLGDCDFEFFLCHRYFDENQPNRVILSVNYDTENEINAMGRIMEEASKIGYTSATGIMTFVNGTNVNLLLALSNKYEEYEDMEKYLWKYFVSANKGKTINSWCIIKDTLEN